MSGYPDIDGGPFMKAILYGPDGVAQAAAGQGLRVMQTPLIPVTATAAAGSAATLTIPAPGAGIFNYLAYLQIILYASAALTGAAAPLLVTTTNLPGSPVFTFPTALAIGQTSEQKYEGLGPLKGNAAATSITVVTPAQAGALWRVNAAYFQA